MKAIVLISTLIMGPFLYAMEDVQTADVGFKGAGHHIAVELLFEDGKDAYKFWFRDNTSNKAVAISVCTYAQEKLDIHIKQIGDPAVKADFQWIFFKSGYSSTSMEKFFPEFQELLQRSRPDCSVKSLQQLRAELTSQAG